MMAAMLETSSTSAPEASPGCDVLAPLHSVIERLQADVKFKQSKIEALNFEIARLKRWRFGTSSESLDNSAQTVLFDLIVTDTREEDAAAAAASRALPATPPMVPVQARHAVRKPFPADLPRIDCHHEIDASHCACACGQAFKRVGEEISEQLDCVPAQFFVQRHIRGKYACQCCQTIQAAPMPAQIIDKGIPAPGLLAQVVIAKHDDHLPLYRQEEIYQRSGVHIPRSSMAQWIGICGVRLAPLAAALREFVLGHSVVHADETPVQLLAPGRGKTKRPCRPRRAAGSTLRQAPTVLRTVDVRAQPRPDAFRARCSVAPEKLSGSELSRLGLGRAALWACWVAERRQQMAARLPLHAGQMNS